MMLVGPGHVAALSRELEAIIGLAQDDVDDTGHGIGAIDGRGPILEHLDAFHGRKRNAVQVHEALVDVQREAIFGEASPIDQHQRAVEPQATQRGPGTACCQVVGEGFRIGA
jgi:hypothetical protein